jgi:hypothetical protein
VRVELEVGGVVFDCRIRWKDLTAIQYTVGRSLHDLYAVYSCRSTPREALILGGIHYNSQLAQDFFSQMGALSD